MRILISNDDGHSAEGLFVLHRELTAIADCIVVVPNSNRSAASSSLTLRVPLRAVTLDNGFIAIDGTPTDCVHLATNGLLDDMPDMVVTGINAGMNMGDDVVYSGTVAAAIEGRFLPNPAIAFSMCSYDPQHFDTGGRVAANLVRQLLRHPLPAETILNVNIPDMPYDELKGIRVTRLGGRHQSGDLIETRDPRGEKMYWVGPPGGVANDAPGTDFHATQNGYVSVTPIHIDMTHHEVVDDIARWVELKR